MRLGKINDKLHFIIILFTVTKILLFFSFICLHFQIEQRRPFIDTAAIIEIQFVDFFLNN